MRKDAFTMIEMVFVIVILGILSAIAIPRFAATKSDASIAKGSSDIASIRSAIVTERQNRLIRGSSNWITKLSSNSTTLFDGNGTAGNELLMYGIRSVSSGDGWAASDTTFRVYTYTVGDISVSFTYSDTNGTFRCNEYDNISGTICQNLTN